LPDMRPNRTCIGRVRAAHRCRCSEVFRIVSWRLPGSERHAARSARAVKHEIHRNENRLAKLEAERNKSGNPPYNPGAFGGRM
jgi:hypothetical protein